MESSDFKEKIRINKMHKFAKFYLLKRGIGLSFYQDMYKKILYYV